MCQVFILTIFYLSCYPFDQSNNNRKGFLITMKTWLVSLLPSLITLIVLLLTLAYGYGKLNQKIDSTSNSLSKDIDHLRRDLAEFRISVQKDWAELRSYFVFPS